MTHRIITLLVGLLVSLCPSQVTAVWSVTGLPDGYAKKLSEAMDGWRDDPNAADSVVAVLQRDGYLDAVVTLTSDTLLVKPGQKYYLRSVRVEGGEHPPIMIGAPMTEPMWRHVTDSILGSYSQVGFLFAQLQLDQLQIELDSLVDASFRVQPGPAVTLSEVVVDGLRRTDPSLVRSHLPIRIGDTLTSGRIMATDRAARRLPFVRLRDSVAVQPRQGMQTADLRLEFAERRQLNIEGMIGYAGDQERDAGVLWSLFAELISPFGGGRQIAIDSRRPDRKHNHFGASLAQPTGWLGPGGSVGLDLLTRDYQNQFYEFAIRGSATSWVRQNLEVGLGLGWRTVATDDPHPSYRRLDVGVQAVRDSRDQTLNPSSGSHLQWDVMYSRRRYADDTLSALQYGSLHETRLEIATSWFVPVSQRLVLKTDINYAGLETDEALPPLAEMILIGGPGTLRGYRNEQFAVLRTAYGSLEPRWRLSGAYLFGFVDGAYLNTRIWREPSVVTEESFKHGYGVGFAVVGEDRSVRLSLAWQPDLVFDEPYLAIRIMSRM